MSDHDARMVADQGRRLGEFVAGYSRATAVDGAVCVRNVLRGTHLSAGSVALAAVQLSCARVFRVGAGCSAGAGRPFSSAPTVSAAGGGRVSEQSVFLDEEPPDAL